MEKAKKSVEQMAKEANGRSRACVNCSLFMNCNMITQKYAAMLSWKALRRDTNKDGMDKLWLHT